MKSGGSKMWKKQFGRKAVESRFLDEEWLKQNLKKSVLGGKDNGKVSF